MKKYFAVIFVLALFGQNVLAAKLVLLTSFENKGFLNTTKRLEKILKKRTAVFDDEIKIIHQANQFDLHRELMDAANDAVFWVSHGAYLELNNEVSIGADQLILDKNFNNVGPIFSLVHPRLKFLSIITCHSKGIIESYQKKIQFYKPQKTFLFDKKIRAVKGLKQSLDEFYNNSLFHEEAQFVPREANFEIKITRKTSGLKGQSLRLYNQNQLITLLPEQKPFQEISYKIKIPVSELTKENLKIELNSGESFMNENSAIGDLQITSEQNQFSWKLFAKPNGQPFGVNSRIFLLESFDRN